MTKKKFTIPVSTLIGSSYSNFKKAVARHRIDKKYRKKYLLSIAISRILDVFGSIEKIRYKNTINNFQITESPVFIIGFWRSGTTLLHNLLCQNPHFGFVNTFQAVFPNHCLMHQWWLKRLAQMLMPERRPVDNVKLDFKFPQEEEIALGNIQLLSFYYFWYFPNEFDEFVNKNLLFKNTTDEELQNWQKVYINLIKTALINTGGRRFISKNPPNLFRIKYILKMFPQAKFICIHRNPYHVISSFIRFAHPVMEEISFQNYDKKDLNIRLIRLYKLFLSKFKKDKNLIPKGNLIEVKYEDLISDELSVIKNIYEALNLEGFDRALPQMEKFLKEGGEFNSGNYLPDEETLQIIKDELGGLISD